MVKKISWTMQDAEIKWVSRRKRKDEMGNETEYAVFQVVHNDSFGTFSLIKVKGKPKNITLMCFKEHIFENVVEGETYSLSGFISFGYGNTFLVIDEAKDITGRRVTKRGFCDRCGESFPDEDLWDINLGLDGEERRVRYCEACCEDIAVDFLLQTANTEPEFFVPIR